MGAFDFKRRSATVECHHRMVSVWHQSTARAIRKHRNHLLSYRSRGTLMSYTDHSAQHSFKSNVPIAWHQSMARESIRRRPLSYSSRGTLMTHTDLSSCAASSPTHLSSSEEASSWHAAMLPSPQFATGCFRVGGSFITCGMDALHVNDNLCCFFLSK